MSSYSSSIERDDQELLALCETFFSSIEPNFGSNVVRIDRETIAFDFPSRFDDYQYRGAASQGHILLELPLSSLRAAQRTLAILGFERHGDDLDLDVVQLRALLDTLDEVSATRVEPGTNGVMRLRPDGVFDYEPRP